MPPKRYFDDERSAKPGTISDELRAALNLHNDKLPMWIYKMRVLGYPPGWLQQADISNSSLQLFDDSSQARSSTSQAEESAFNPECFVEFPGFNAPVPEGVQDHCELLGMPPMQVWQQLNYVKLTIPPPKPVPYKRIKLGKCPEPEPKASDDSVYSIDDDDDDDDEVQIIDPANSVEKTKPSKIRNEEKEEGEASDSDDDIIAINCTPKKPSGVLKDISGPTTTIELIPPLNTPQSSNNSQSPILIESPSKIDEKSQSSPYLITTKDDGPLDEQGNNESSENLEESNVSNKSTIEILKDDERQSSSFNGTKPVENSSSSLGKSPSMKLIGLGCPIPADIDHKKPPLEKFAVGMGELIYFENLPTSTGVFDKMRNVIFKVRKKLSE